MRQQQPGALLAGLCLLTCGGQVDGLSLGRQDPPPQSPQERRSALVEAADLEEEFFHAEVTDASWPPPILSELPPLKEPSLEEARMTLQVPGDKCLGPQVGQVKRDQPFVRVPSAAAAAQATGRTAPWKHCDHLSLSVPEQLDAVVGNTSARKETWAWTVSNSLYGDVIAGWQVQLRRVGVSQALVVAVDKDPEWARRLCYQGFNVVDANKQGKRSMSVMRAKFTLPEQFMRLRVRNVFQELDIFWRRDANDTLHNLWKYSSDADIVLAYQGLNSRQEPEMNIGFWMSPAEPSASLAEFFRLVLMRSEKSSSWDQFNMNQVAAQCSTILKVGFNNLGDLMYGHDYRPIVCPEELKKLKVAALPENALISNTYFRAPKPGSDLPKLAPDGFHIWASSPLFSGRGKVAVAMNAGLYEGLGCYYEDCPDSKERYIAWDGALPAGREKASMRSLLDLGWSLGRVVIMPRMEFKSINSHSHGLTFGERYFGVYHLDTLIGVRESNFLYHSFLGGQKKRAMYPVSRVAVRAGGSASLQSVDAELSETSRHFAVPAAAAGDDVAAVLSKRPEVKSSKTLLVSIDDLPGHSCGGVDKAMPLCGGGKDSRRSMSAVDVC